MNATSDASSQIAAVGATDTRLRGSALLVARVIWLLLLAMLLVFVGAGVPDYLASLRHVAADGTSALTPGAAEALQRLGIGLDTFTVVATVVAGAIVLITLGLALVLVWRRGHDWMVLLVSLFLIAYILGNINVSDTAPAFSSAFALILYVLQGAAFAALFYAGFLLFPNGRFAPRWSWLLLVAFVVWILVANLTHMEILGGWLVLGYPLFYGAALVNIVYRYRRVMTPVQQQQTKWVVAGFVASLLANQLFWLPSGLTPLGNTLYLPLSYLGYLMVLLVVPITFFIAIQRYRLYEIDTILNRALVYGLLTVILAAIYAAGVIGSQTIVGGLTHASGEGQSPLTIVATTLVIAALFQPLRRRLQSFIDRRFYRRKYDAERTLATFAATLREQVDLPELRDHLLATVDEAMQPAHVSLWFKTQVGDHVGDRPYLETPVSAASRRS
ncbi:MAG TPA: hypothetical protein VGP82_01745 [Ktedonobacterales bacterium]|nr:hypothetical protein [Ktedonobacterales bacterium]